MKTLNLLLAIPAVVVGTTALADEAKIRMKDGPELTTLVANCSGCHSLDYIQMNSPFQDATGWDKTVTKMVKVMGAPITPEDSAVIVAYLATHYGKEAAR